MMHLTLYGTENQKMQKFFLSLDAVDPESTSYRFFGANLIGEDAN